MNNPTFGNGSNTALHSSAFKSSMLETASQQAQTLALFIAIIVTNVLGAIGNILLLLTMLRYPPLRKSSSSPLIMHCIIIDLYITLVAAPAVIIPFYLTTF